MVLQIITLHYEIFKNQRVIIMIEAEFERRILKFKKNIWIFSFILY